MTLGKENIKAGAGRPRVDRPEAADLHRVAAAAVDAEDIECCSASSNEKKKLTIKRCFLVYVPAKTSSNEIY